MTKVDLLIKNGVVVTMSDEALLLNGADIAVQDGRILDIGFGLDYAATKVLDASDKVVMPGFVDAHMHETLTRGLSEDLPLDRWLNELRFPIDGQHNEESIHAAAMMNQLEMIRGGITTFLDIYRFPHIAAEVVTTSGLRGVFTPQIISEPVGAGETLATNLAFVEAWINRHPRVIPAFGPHAPYTVSANDLQEISRLSDRFDVSVHTHLSETQWEVDMFNERFGCSPAEYLEKNGILNSRLSVAHGVCLSDTDIKLLAATDVAVVHNPSSNMKLASGVAPIADIIRAGIRLGLGTDSNLSNNNLDMFEEMRTAAFLHKCDLMDATFLPCNQILDMATMGSARVLKLENEIGSLEVGKQADIILIDRNQPHLWPMLTEGEYSNVIEQIVYSANAADVTDTIVSGVVLMENREVLTLDIEEVRREVEKETKALLQRAGLIA